MAERVLSDDEVKRLGLDRPKKERVLSDDEVAALGLDAPAPTGKVASPTGWRDASKSPDLLDQVLAGKQREDPYMWGALAAGAHGAANAMEGPVNGAIEAVKQDAKNLFGGTPLHPDVSPSDAYYKEKDRIEGEQAQNLKDFPNAPIVGALMSGGVGSAPSAVGRVGMATGQGLLYGYGSSKHDLREQDSAPLRNDTLLGGGAGFVGGLGGEALNAGASALGNKLSGVLDKNLAGAQTLADKVMKSARGTLGAEVSSGSRILEVLEEAAKGTNPNVDPALARAASEFLASDGGAALRNQVIRSSLARGEGQLGKIQGARDALTGAIEGQAPEAVQQAANARLNDSSALWRRVREVAPKVILPALGGWMGGPEGAAAGGLAAAVLGRSGTTVRNALVDPYVASRVLGAGSSALGGAGSATSHAAPGLLQKYLDLLHDKDAEQ
jgi:hypothetical protein